MRRMQQHYGGMAGGAAIAKQVDVPGSLPVNVYQFHFFFKIMEVLLTNKDLMNGSLWVYDPKENERGERVYGEMNTGDAWKDADSYFRKRVDDLLYTVESKQTRNTF